MILMRLSGVGEYVLVLAASGGVGMAAVQLAKVSFHSRVSLWGIFI